MSERPPVTDWATDFDHLEARWVNDPFPIWDELRKKLQAATGGQHYIETVWGRGYVLRDPSDGQAAA